MRVVVLGGRGNFGARIVRALEADLHVVAAGRREGVDIAAPALAAKLAALAPDIVVNCAGPFQGQGYHVAHAALAARAHYIDLADGRDFVAGFAAGVDAAASAAGRLAVSGASSLPALSSAVVDHLLPRFSRLDASDCVIAPGQHAPRGPATITGVMSYAGQPFDVWEEGGWRRRHGWQHVRRVPVHPLAPRLSAVCDVPDLALFPARYPGVRSVRFRAALEVGIQHRALAFMAATRRMGLPVPVARLARSMDRAAGWLDRFGSGTGAMNVILRGVGAEGDPLALRWHVLAAGNHGPEIPCMAAVLLARKLAGGELAGHGARACMGMLTLGDFAPLFTQWGMATGIEPVG